MNLPSFLGLNGKISDLKFKFLFMSNRGNNGQDEGCYRFISSKSDPEVQFRLKNVY